MLTKNLCNILGIRKEDYSPKRTPIIEYLQKENNVNALLQPLTLFLVVIDLYGIARNLCFFIKMHIATQTFPQAYTHD